MAFANSGLIIIIVVAVALYLIYSQNSQKKYYQNMQNKTSSLNNAIVPNQYTYATPNNIIQPFSQVDDCPTCKTRTYQYQNNNVKLAPEVKQTTQTTHTLTTNTNGTDIHTDSIKTQDLHTMYDPLAYPQQRLPREILEKYNDYFDKYGVYPPFNNSTQPLFDNPIQNGVLIKQVDENEPFHDNIPSSVPLFRVKSTRNANRYFYYIIDQRYMSKVEPKIPLDNVKINNVRHNNADYYGLPELLDGDVIEQIPIYPNAKFKLLSYKMNHFM